MDNNEFIAMLTSRIVTSVTLVNGKPTSVGTFDCGCNITVVNPDAQEEYEVESAFVCGEHSESAEIGFYYRTLEFQFMRHLARAALREELIRRGEKDRWQSTSVDLDPEDWADEDDVVN